VECQARDIKVGCFVKITDDENFPCDIVLINSSLPKGICYVETKGLDGETNLKAKQAREEMLRFSENESDLFQNFTDCTIQCDMPNASLYKFQGTLTMADGAIHPLSADQVLLKGSILRNSGHVYGIACYTGHQTKVMKNSLKARVKKSKVELQTNFYIIIIVSIQLTVCLTSALADMIVTNTIAGTDKYIFYNFTQTSIQVFGKSIFNWFLLLQNFVSISLLVTLEMVKLFQAQFIESDWMLYDIEKDMHTKVNSSNLNEELGMVSYIFSDKTGTLTQNIMEF
jgi:phospholipid-transporting ATPase